MPSAPPALTDDVKIDLDEEKEAEDIANIGGEDSPPALRLFVVHTDIRGHFTRRGILGLYPDQAY